MPEDVDEPANKVSEAVHGGPANLAQHALEPGECFLDRDEVRAVWRKEAQGCTDRLDRLLYRCPLVASEVVHDDNVTGTKLGHQDLHHVSFDPVAVD